MTGRIQDGRIHKRRDSGLEGYRKGGFRIGGMQSAEQER